MENRQVNLLDGADILAHGQRTAIWRVRCYNMVERTMVPGNVREDQLQQNPILESMNPLDAVEIRSLQGAAVMKPALLKPNKN